MVKDHMAVSGRVEGSSAEQSSRRWPEGKAGHPTRNSEETRYNMSGYGA